jgi:hypothetical protein
MKSGLKPTCPPQGRCRSRVIAIYALTENLLSAVKVCNRGSTSDP